MNSMELVKTAQAMVDEGKGILAIDESTGTCKKRFDAIGVACTGRFAARLPRHVIDFTRAGRIHQRRDPV